VGEWVSIKLTAHTVDCGLAIKCTPHTWCNHQMDTTRVSIKWTPHYHLHMTLSTGHRHYEGVTMRALIDYQLLTTVKGVCERQIVASVHVRAGVRRYA